MSTANEDLVRQLNNALGWELRAQVMYAHYAAYVRGIYRLHLKPYFEGESAESVTHATTVRDQIVKVNRVFRKLVGVNPSQYRVRGREDQLEATPNALHDVERLQSTGS